MRASNHIEQMVRALHVTTNALLDDRILADAVGALEGATAGKPRHAGVSPWHVVVDSRVLRVAAMIGVTAVIVTTGITVWKRGIGSVQQVVRIPLRPTDTNAPSQADKVRQKIDALHAARDVDGLIEALNSDPMEYRILIAECLGEIADGRAIPALAQLASQWQGSPADNPFARAIREIENRTQRPEPNVPMQSPELQSQAVPVGKPARILTGTITDAKTGEPVEGVDVQVTPSGGGRVYRATTDSNGVYSFDRIDADDSYHILLNAPDHIAPAEWERPREILQLQAGGQITKDYALERGCRVVIKATDEKGRPVKGVNVYAVYVSDDMGRGPKRPSRSDANGVVVLGGLRPDMYHIVAAHPNYALTGQKVALEEPKQVTSLAFDLKTGIDVPGIATCSDGLPAAGWTIEAKPSEWKSVYSWPRNDPVAHDGTFILKHVLAGPHRLAVSIPEKDRGSRGVWSTDVNLPPEKGLLDLKIPMPSPQGRASISGRVRFSGDQAHDGGFWINAIGVAVHSGVEAGPITTVNSGSVWLGSGEQDFVIGDLVPGLYDLDITIAGQRKEFKNIKAPSEGIVLELTTAKAISRKGRVVDSQTGKPVTDFELRIVGEQEYRQISDRGGVFQVRSRGPECRVQIKTQGYGDAISENLYRDVNEPVLIELRLPTTLAGVVVDEAGRPIEGAIVSYRYGRRADRPSEANDLAITDAKGRFTVDDVSADDTWQWFVVRHPDYARAIRRVTPGKGDVIQEKIVLTKGATIEGTVYDWQGKPVPDTPVYFLDQPQFSHWKHNLSRLGLAMTDDSGFYRIEHMPEELCYAFRDDPYGADALGVVETAILPRSGRTNRLDLGGLWKATGRLVKDGEPAADTKLLVSFRAGVTQVLDAYTTSDSDGRFAFYGLPAGRRSVYWAVPGIRSYNKWAKLATFDFQEGVDLDLGEFNLTLAEVTIDLARASPEVPADGWNVVLYERDSQGHWARMAGRLKIRSDHADPFVFCDVPAGMFDAVAQRNGYPMIRQSVEIKSGQTSGRIVMRVPAGSGVISGKTMSGTGSLPHVVLRSADERITADTRANVDGTFEFANLPAGQYVVGVGYAGAEQLAMPARVDLGPAEHKTVQMNLDSAEGSRPDSSFLVVHVVTQDGLPLATSDLWLERAGRVIEPEVYTDVPRYFTSEPGRYTLGAEYPGYRSIRTSVVMKSRQDPSVQAREPLVITMIKQ